MDIDINLVHKVIVVVIGVVTLWLGFLVYSSNPKGKINQYFSLMAVLLFIWITFGYLSSVFFIGRDVLGLALNKINIFAVCLFLIPFYFFSVYFPVEEKKRHRLLDKFIVIYWLVLAIISLFSDLTVASMNNGIVKYGDVVGQIFLLSTVLAVIYAIILVFNKTRKLQGVEKKRATYFLSGMLIWFVFNVIFNVLGEVIFGSLKYYAFGDYSAIFFLALVFYSIVKQQLFGVKVIVTYAIVSLITILLSVDLLVFTHNTSLQLLKVATLFVFLYFGRSLINSVKKEIELKEELQDLNLHLQDKVDEQTKEIKVAYEVEKTARIKLEELDKVKDEFITTAAHQLRTPLSGTRWALKSFLDGTLGETSLNDIQRDLLEKTYNNNNNLINIVGDLLDTSSIENKNLTYDFQETEISLLLKEVVSKSIFLMRDKKIKINYHEPEDHKIFLMFDKEKLSNALQNIMSNSIDYTPDGGEIDVNLKKENNQVIIEIKDNGIGILEEDKAHLFEKFYRGVNAKLTETDRSGLGLYISKQIIEKHGGTIAVESKEGEGTKVVVRLPI